MDYKNTPSFYNNEEYFNKYLGQTSYYLGLQRTVDTLISIIKPQSVLELGSALGTTTVKLASNYPQIRFTGSDIREDVVLLANESSKECQNVSFFADDMCNIVKNSLEEYDFIFMLYSFHHIPDPIENKISFLNSSYKNMKSNSYMLIMETFLPENVKSFEKDSAILRLWDQRSHEGYASTYWAVLNDLSPEGIDFAKKVAQTSQKEEREAGNHVYNRDDEYLITLSWLEENAQKSGFNVILSEPVNCIEEKAILLKKD